VLPNNKGGERIGSPIPAPATPPLWPNKIDLLDLLPYGPSLQNIVLGVTLDQSGQQQVIAAPLAKLVHIAVGGSSGWGKSVFLRALAYQLVAAPEPVELALIDLEATTFSPFATSSRLRCAIADTEPDALNILSHLSQELEYRKQLFKAYPTAEQLSDYNRLAAEPLPLVALLVDEATALLSDKSVEEQIRTLALRARKYGIYAVLGGQDWKAASLDTAIRNQLSTRIQFKAQDGTQSRVLLGTSEAARIEQVGRAYAVLPGRPRLELQAPHIDLTTIAAQAERGVTMALPEPASALPQPKSALDQRIYAAITQHEPGSTISFSQLFKAQTWGMSKPTFINHVKRVVEACALTEKYQVGADLPENFR
jgi:DNA segregation ATPase FtsK/SpoIIIE-like protein